MLCTPCHPRVTAQALEQYLHVSSLAALASSLVHTGQLPDRFNTLILPLMNCLRREPQLRLQVGACSGCGVVKGKEVMVFRGSYATFCMPHFSLLFVRLARCYTLSSLHRVLVQHNCRM